SQRDASLEPAVIVEEPRAAGESRLPRAHHLEHPQQALAIALVGNAEALEDLVMDSGIRIVQQTDRIAQDRARILDQRRRKTIVGRLGMILHETHRGTKRPPPFLRGARLVAASAVRAP